MSSVKTVPLVGSLFFPLYAPLQGPPELIGEVYARDCELVCREDALGNAGTGMALAFVQCEYTDL
jgi:hypothetical protein